MSDTAETTAADSEAASSSGSTAGDVVDGGDLDKPDQLLRVEGVTKEFGGIVANNDVSLSVQAGTITGLIGPNGAGKSTLFNCITGFHEPDEGSVYVGDDEVTGMDPHEIAYQGLIRSFQTPRKPEGMTVREALLVGPQQQLGESILPLFTSPEAVRQQESASMADAREIMERFEIDHLSTALATDLSGGQMKLVELARAMMSEPDLLLLDEPVSGVNPTLAEKLKGYIRKLNDDGVTMLIIEHDMSFIMEMADPIIVLNQGQVLVEGSPEAVRADDRVIDAYLGGGT
jgi:ABC-type branched-subunit amino acid transport system ATPase component